MKKHNQEIKPSPVMTEKPEVIPSEQLAQARKENEASIHKIAEVFDNERVDDKTDQEHIIVTSADGKIKTHISKRVKVSKKTLKERIQLALGKTADDEQ